MLTLVDGLPLPTMLVTGDGTVEMCNRLAVRLFGGPGVSGVAFYGDGVGDIPRPDWVAGLLARLKAVGDDGSSVETVLPTRRGRGCTFPRTWTGCAEHH